MHKFSRSFEHQRAACRGGRFAAAEQILEQMHRQAHANAAVHLRVHFETARLRVAQRRYPSAGKELLAMGFAAPTSWVQKYFGWVRSDV